MGDPIEIVWKAVFDELGIAITYGAERGLQRHVEPVDLVPIEDDIYGRRQLLRAPAARAWRTLRQRAFDEGVELQVVSAYRSFEYQADIIRRHLASGQKIADILSRVAAPGFSEHQSGCALDINEAGCDPVELTFESTAAFKWLSDHASTFSFVLSYPRDNPHGVVYEPWHWCWRTPIAADKAAAHS